MSLPHDNIRRPSAWLAGALHVAVQVDLPGDGSQVDVVSETRRIATDILGDIQVNQPDREAPQLLIPTLVGSRHLAFVPITLASEAPRAMKQAVSMLDSDTELVRRGAGLPGWQPRQQPRASPAIRESYSLFSVTWSSRRGRGGGALRMGSDT